MAKSQRDSRSKAAAPRIEVAVDLRATVDVPAASPAVARRSTATLPTALGYRMPAEWEPQEATWLSWPHRRATWPGRFRPVPGVFARLAAEISRRQVVRINAARPRHAAIRALLRRAGAVMAQVELYPHPTDDAWCRDHGPIFIRRDRTGDVALVHWDYNSWGGKYPPFDRDRRIPERIARAIGVRRFRAPLVLEGGSIDVNGAGALLTTESCLLNPNRNPSLSRSEIEQALRDYLGVATIHWLGAGIAGDDTDGHVDDLSRFYSEEGIVTVVEKNPRDPNYAPLRDNLERLRSFRTPGGQKYSLVDIALPKPAGTRARRVPASYANFLILNDAVLLPTFRQPKADAAAAEILGECFRGREIVPLDCLDLVWGLGAIHCVTQQQPARENLARFLSE